MQKRDKQKEQSPHSSLSESGRAQDVRDPQISRKARQRFYWVVLHAACQRELLPKNKVVVFAVPLWYHSCPMRPSASQQSEIHKAQSSSRFLPLFDSAPLPAPAAPSVVGAEPRQACACASRSGLPCWSRV